MSSGVSSGPGSPGVGASARSATADLVEPEAQPRELDRCAVDAQAGAKPRDRLNRHLQPRESDYLAASAGDQPTNSNLQLLGRNYSLCVWPAFFVVHTTFVPVAESCGHGAEVRPKTDLFRSSAADDLLGADVSDGTVEVLEHLRALVLLEIDELHGEIRNT
jgi:hypothetical protein